MLHHVSVGVSNVEDAAAFYDAVLGALGYRRVMEYLPYGIAYGDTDPAFWIQLPHNQQVATAGNGVHICFAAPSKKAVDGFHAKALALGAQNAGAPGPRPEYSPDYYAAFIIDADGNKLEAVLLPKAPAKKPVKKTAKKVAKKTTKKAAAKKPAAKAAPKAKPAKKTKKAKKKGKK
jgi:catechol 2,3-dioxygenase-like lactoylglutathione lyase family enzyme